MGNFETITNIIAFNQEQEDLARAEDLKPEGNCPYCEWPLNINNNGVVACPICQRIWS